MEQQMLAASFDEPNGLSYYIMFQLFRTRLKRLRILYFNTGNLGGAGELLR
jgi:hypothetical protein